MNNIRKQMWNILQVIALFCSIARILQVLFLVDDPSNNQMVSFNFACLIVLLIILDKD